MGGLNSVTADVGLQNQFDNILGLGLQTEDGLPIVGYRAFHDVDLQNQIDNIQGLGMQTNNGLPSISLQTGQSLGMQIDDGVPSVGLQTFHDVDLQNQIDNIQGLGVQSSNGLPFSHVSEIDNVQGLVGLQASDDVFGGLQNSETNFWSRNKDNFQDNAITCI